MDTKPLERFATWARRELLTSVDAQISAVLASGSIARAERGEAVRRLETEIERHGRQHVTDKVAYIWFNRIIALRFMDARGYTDAGVVSPMSGQEHGQPEILADAKRGALDTEVVTNKRVADSILGLLDGTRSSADAEGEAYALLLTEYCHFWHKSMPFMFEREGDYTELLVPGNLLADGSVLSRARDALTEEVCGDVEVIGWLYQFYISERKDEVFADFKQNKKAGADEIPAATQLFTPHWIVRYLVENSVGRLWMLNRPQSHLIEQMEYYIKPVDEETDFLKINGPEEITVIDPASGSGHMLTYAFDLLYAIYEEEGYAPSDIPTLILQNNLYGTEIDPRAGALAAFALTMKARAKQRTFFTKQIAPKIVVIEPIKFRPDEVDVLLGGVESSVADQVFWNQFEQADVLGSLIMPNRAEIETAKTTLAQAGGRNDIIYSGTFSQAEKFIRQADILSKNYAVVVANPPYMSSRSMSQKLSEYVGEVFPLTKHDLFAAFIEICAKNAKTHGYVAMITMHGWMFTGAYTNFREFLISNFPPVGVAHLGSGAFDSIGGEVVQTVAFILKNTINHKENGTYIRLVDFPDEINKQSSLKVAANDPTSEVRWNRSPSSFEFIPGKPLAYWLDSDQLKAFRSSKFVSDIAHATKGIDTGENTRFLRRWFEISASDRAQRTPGLETKKWVLYNKGGGSRRWYGLREYVLNWEDNGSALKDAQSNITKKARVSNEGLFFTEGFTWSTVSPGLFGIRYTPADSAFDNGGSTLFAENELLAIGGLLNTKFISGILEFLAPTINTQPGDIKRVPVPQLLPDIEKEVLECIEISQNDWDSNELSADFKASPLIAKNEKLTTQIGNYLNFVNDQKTILKKLECSIEEKVRNAYGVESTGSHERPVTLFEHTKLSLINDFVSYAVGCMFGRYSLDEPGLILANQGETLQDYLAKVPSPSFMPDADNVIPFVDDGWFEDDIVERFREFLRVMFGTEHFEENMRFIEESLGVKTIRDYFITRNGKSKFYDDHVKRYKKRPIYWMFSSPKGSFNALIYMHRYTSSTVSTVLNEYLREYRAKLEVALTNVEEAAAAGSVKDQKEADRLRKVLVELAEYEHDVLYPLATKQLPIDLDDGVLVNYLRLGRALKNIGFEKDRKKVEGWDWPHYPLEPVK